MLANTKTLEELLAVGRFMNELPIQWWVGGGWAIDVWIGKASREHEDIEICVLRSDQESLHEVCSDWNFYTPVDNQWSPMSENERLGTDGFMLQLRRSSAAHLAVEGMPSEFEFILNDVENGEWIFRFDPTIRLPLTAVYSMSPLGLPVIAPEILLLHKAWYPPRPKDEQDFTTVLDHLNTNQRLWLYENLKYIRPEHVWLRQLKV